MRYLLASALIAIAALPADAADTVPPPTTAPDNSGVNVRDRDGATRTPEDQGGDTTLVAAVRRAITRDDTVSMAGRNVKIVITGGVATLRGPVQDEAEKRKIAAIVAKVEGITSVDNQLDIAAK